MPKQTVHPTLQLQPTFSAELPWSKDEAIARLRDARSKTSFHTTCSSAGACFDFQVEQQVQRLWSPHLSIQIGESEQSSDCSELHGRFSPMPSVWTIIVAVYAILSFCAFGGLIYAYAQWMLGSTPWALVIAPICIIGILSLHIISLTGQRLSSDQMQLLKDQLTELIETAKAAPATQT